VNRFKDPDDPRNVGGAQGLPGSYRVTFVLSRPGFNLMPENHHSFVSGMRGDSHLAIAKPAFLPPGNPEADRIQVSGATEDGTFVFWGFPNQQGFLGKFESQPFEALGFNDAELKAYRAIASSLSNWAAHLDIPLNIAQVESTELRTGNVRTSVTTAYVETPLAILPSAVLKPEFRGYASLYREAMNNVSPVYQFLCLFKMIEGMLRRRARLGKEARKAGTTIARAQEHIPGTVDDAISWLNAIFPMRRSWDPMALSSIFPDNIFGKSFKYIIDKYLYPMRVDIAHAVVSQSGELSQSIDELVHAQNLNKWLPLTKCIVRRMLKNEFPGEFLAYLREDGTVVGN
jgi:hypothetical protein